MRKVHWLTGFPFWNLACKTKWYDGLTWAILKRNVTCKKCLKKMGVKNGQARAE